MVVLGRRREVGGRGRAGGGRHEAEGMRQEAVRRGRKAGGALASFDVYLPYAVLLYNSRHRHPEESSRCVSRLRWFPPERFVVKLNKSKSFGYSI